MLKELAAKSDSKMRSQIKNDIEKYCNNSTIQGALYCSRQYSALERVVWLIIILGMLFMASLLVHGTFNSWGQNPIQGKLKYLLGGGSILQSAECCALVVRNQANHCSIKGSFSNVAT